MVAVGLGTSGIVAAQTQTPPPATNPPGQAAPQRGGRQAPPVNVVQAENQVTAQWNVAVLRQSKAALQLNDQQFPFFFMKMSDLQAVRDRHQQQHRRLINELTKLTALDDPADDATVTAKASELDALEQQMHQQELQALAAVDAVLTPYQRGRFRVFEENMEKQKLRLLAAALRGGKTPQG
jgi:Spy/CpxP family protein refolding chaperone